MLLQPFGGSRGEASVSFASCVKNLTTQKSSSESCFSVMSLRPRLASPGHIGSCPVPHSLTLLSQAIARRGNSEGLGDGDPCCLSLWAIGFQLSLLEDPKDLLVLRPFSEARALL